MNAIPIELKAVNQFVSIIHRHHTPVYCDKFRLACIADDGHMCGVIQAARPVSRMLDDGVTIEIVRCCTDGTKKLIHTDIVGIARAVQGILKRHNVINKGGANYYEDKSKLYDQMMKRR